MTITQREEDGHTVLYLEGRLDTSTSPILEEHVDDNIADCSKLVVDMQRLEYISSAGLRVLLSMQKIMDRQQGRMVIRHVNDIVMEVFEITGFADVLTII